MLSPPARRRFACSVTSALHRSGLAGFALENRLALAVSGCDVPARGASLRRVRSRDLLDPTESFVPQTRGELAPATSADRPVEPTLLGDSHARPLDGAARERVIARTSSASTLITSNRRARSVVVFDPVLAPICLAAFSFAIARFDFARRLEPRLPRASRCCKHLQPFRLTRGQTGCMQQFAGRQRSRHHDTAVNADHTAVAWTGDRVGMWANATCQRPARSRVTR